jgi:hypothetical protein
MDAGRRSTRLNGRTELCPHRRCWADELLRRWRLVRGVHATRLPAHGGLLHAVVLWARLLARRDLAAIERSISPSDLG